MDQYFPKFNVSFWVAPFHCLLACMCVVREHVELWMSNDMAK